MQEVSCRLSGRIRLAVAALVVAALSMAGPVQSASAGGDAIVYAKQGDIYRADPSGANPLRLTVACGCGRPVLSPDGEMVAFDGGSAGKLYLIDIEGTSLRTVLSDPSMQPLDPAFLPDGRSLVFKQNGQGTAANNFYSDLYKIAIDGTGLTRLTAFSGREDQPTVSAGGLIAFSYQATNGTGRIATINSDGSGFRDFSPRGAAGPAAPSISPNGAQIAFGGYKSSKDVGKDTLAEIFLVSSTGGTAQQVTSNLYWESQPTWTTDGSRIAYSTERRPPPPEHSLGGSPQDVWIFDPSSGVHSPLIEDTWPGVNYPAYRQARPALNQQSADGLLTRYVPMLKYDSQELYFADSAETITFNPGNSLKRADGSTIENAPFSLSFLAWPTYVSTGATSSESDYLDERNENYQGDAAGMHATLLGNKVYARAKQDPITGKWWLQYWLWYYYNSQEVAGIGVHEGDWEMVQIRLDGNGAPDAATYAQHTGGERCNYGVVEKFWASGGHPVPVVYVANASHASYFAAGSYERTTGGTIPVPLPTDEANGQSSNSVQPAIEQSISDPAPTWAHWRGRWGSSGEGSPTGPGRKGTKWTDPGAWHASTDVSDCRVAGGATMANRNVLRRTMPRRKVVVRSRRPAPPKPRVWAKRDGDRVTVRFRVAEPRNRSARPARLMVTIHPAGRRYSPSGRLFVLKRHRGTKTVTLPEFGRGPYTVRASSVAKTGRRSDILSLRLP
jgi:Tol biopolymer transport system component